MAFATKMVLHEMKRKQEKEKAIRFYEENGALKEIEKLLNVMVVDRPRDVYGVMADYFQELSLPGVISRVKGRITYASSFDRALQVDLSCVLNEKEKVKTYV